MHLFQPKGTRWSLMCVKSQSKKLYAISLKYRQKFSENMEYVAIRLKNKLLVYYYNFIINIINILAKLHQLLHFTIMQLLIRVILGEFIRTKYILIYSYIFFFYLFAYRIFTILYVYMIL